MSIEEIKEWRNRNLEALLYGPECFEVSTAIDPCLPR